jgi:hypothetical protein
MQAVLLQKEVRILEDFETSLHHTFRHINKIAHVGVLREAAALSLASALPVY